jgi:hypothetical protein
MIHWWRGPPDAKNSGPQIKSTAVRAHAYVFAERDGAREAAVLGNLDLVVVRALVARVPRAHPLAPRRVTPANSVPRLFNCDWPTLAKNRRLAYNTAHTTG